MSSKTILLLLVLATGCLWAQEKQEKKDQAPPASGSSTAATPASPHPATISPQDVARKNPVKCTETSVQRGKKIYMTQCALCHGENGDGKGEMVSDMKINPPDFTKPETLKQRTDGELFAIITTGKEAMPDQSRLTEQHKWNLVNFLRVLGGKTPEKPTGKEPEENIILVPQ